ESRERVYQLPLDRFYCEQWHQTDDRSNFQWQIAPTGCVQQVVIEFIFFVPETNSSPAQIVHGGRDAEEMFEKLGRDIFVNMIFTGERDRDAHQIQRKHSHPAGASALFTTAAVGA